METIHQFKHRFDRLPTQGGHRENKSILDNYILSLQSCNIIKKAVHDTLKALPVSDLIKNVKLKLQLHSHGRKSQI